MCGVAYTMPYTFAPCLPDLKDSEAPKQQGLRELRQGGPFRPRRRLCQVFDLHMPHLQERPPELLAPLQGKHGGLWWSARGRAMLTGHAAVLPVLAECDTVQLDDG